jgi:DNA-binding transcriptional LysR family regulator
VKLLRNTLLETFVTVVECGGFTDAQYALGITQSAVSIRIRDLETALGYRVCERGRGGFRLTERGEIAYRKARDILRSARDFDAELLELRDTITGDLRIGVADAVSSLPGVGLAKALKRFLSRPNDVRLELVIASPTDLTQGLISGSLHVGIAPFRKFVPELDYSSLCAEEHRLYCGRSHHLFDAPPQSIDAEVLTAHPMCQLSYDLMATPELGVPEPKAVVSNMEAMAIVIESGQFLGTLPAHFAAPLVQTGTLRELAHPDLQWSSEFFLATRRAQVQRQAVELFAGDIGSAGSDP